jgi:hypothetical protein
MKRISKIAGLILISFLSLATVGGCDDGVRQTVSPYLFTGLQTIAQGLIAGLEQQVYPEGSTSSPQSTSH